MPNASDVYRKLCRLRTKRQRLDKRIAVLVRKLQGKKYRWGNCSDNHNR